jgi:hypothetical protein
MRSARFGKFCALCAMAHDADNASAAAVMQRMLFFIWSPLLLCSVSMMVNLTRLRFDPAIRSRYLAADIPNPRRVQ